MLLFYRLGIYIYGTFLALASLFHPKAQQWIRGRKNWQQSLKSKIQAQEKWIWFHCASLGEFEQGRNLIEDIKTEFPSYKILLTFFSPSGFEVRKNYSYADHVCYIPLDTPANARQFLDIVQPRWVAFVKYELWLNFLQEMAARKIPVILVSARVLENSPFFKSAFSELYRKAFRQMRAIFTQDESSAQLLRDFSQNPHIKVSSDTRYDRVSANRQEFQPIGSIEAFKKNRLCMVAGSTWPKGEQVLFSALDKWLQKDDFCLILAPHEIHSSRIQQWIDKYPEMSLIFSKMDQFEDRHRILWIDNIGMLSRLYYYADIAYVGGAWKTGLHNILEAAVFGCPVIIGPQYEKFPEAADLIQAGGAFSIKDEGDMYQLLQTFRSKPALRAQIKLINQSFIAARAGATKEILDWCKNEQLL